MHMRYVPNLMSSCSHNYFHASVESEGDKDMAQISRILCSFSPVL